MHVPHEETKSIFRPSICHSLNQHIVGCRKSGGKAQQVLSVNRETCEKCTKRKEFPAMHYHEEEIAQSLLAINHYRFTDYEDIKKKCAPDAAISGYQVSDCMAKMTAHSNYPEIYDEIMLRKWRRDAEED